jgi:putative endonuclease
MNQHFVYIIESSSSGKWYYGYTTNPEKRVDFHNQGLNVSTRNNGPWRMIFLQQFQSKKEALQFELHLKKSKNKDFIRRAYAKSFL